MLLGGCGQKAPPVSFDTVVPKAVMDLEASVREGRVILQWSLPKENTDGTKLVDLVGFTILRESFEGQECKGCPERLVPIAEVDLVSGAPYLTEAGRVTWADMGLQAGRTYKYRVIPFNRRSHFGQKSNQVGVLWDDPLPPPRQFSAMAGDGMAALEWTFVEEALGYNLYRSKPGKAFPLRPVNPEPIEAPRYRDTRVVNDREYRYAVRSVSKAGKTLIEGVSSTFLIVTPVDVIPPSPPEGLAAFPLAQGVELRWIANPEPDVVGYHVYRRKIHEPTFERITEEMVRDTVYMDVGVIRGEEYDYHVTAIDGSRNRNESGFSEMARVRYTYIQ
jgi:hypothetical protein